MSFSAGAAFTFSMKPYYFFSLFKIFIISSRSYHTSPFTQTVTGNSALVSSVSKKLKNLMMRYWCQWFRTIVSALPCFQFTF
jgi:hypothetical protein